MARSIRASTLETRTARLKLPVAKKPLFVKIALRVGLGYRRNQTTGTWVARVADGKGGNWTKVIATADDFEDADGGAILDFWQAQRRARTIARGGTDGDDSKPITVEQALDRYEADLKTRGGDVANVARIRLHLSEALARKTVALLTARDLRGWRDGLTKKKLAPATANRSSGSFKAALNLAADHDERIASRGAWEKGLASIPDATESRNVILTEPLIYDIIAAAKTIGIEFALLVELAAVTGARVSQLARLEVQDVQADRADPRLMMPSSRKGRGQKKIMRRPVPIPESLVERLRHAIGDRPNDAPLLTKLGGTSWKRSDHTRLFRRAVTHAGLDPDHITLAALRHSSIVRQLLGGVPIRVVAVNHDTGITMLEKTYSRYIGDHSDALSRRVLLDTGRPANHNVVPPPTRDNAGAGR
jgi:integrase